MASNVGVKITKANLSEAVAGIEALARSEILVGFPEKTTERDEAAPITNAALGYIHDNGDPAHNIPARPFMQPGIADAEKEIEKYLSGAMRAALRGNLSAAEGQMIAAGLAAKLGIQKKINEGIPPPLAESTLRARARRGRKGAAYELERRSKGLDAGVGMQLLGAKPLIDTAQMRNAVNFVIRAKKARG